MRVFLMHIGHPGHVDIDYTVTRKRSITEIVQALPNTAPELPYFQSDHLLQSVFPSGEFNCWGVPSRAEPSFNRTEPGDLVLFVPWIGVHGGGVHQLGIVKAKCSVSALYASEILWPNTPHDRLYPLLFFFETEVGVRPWYDFLADMDYAENWHPRGWYRSIGETRFLRWGGPQGYLKFLREQCGFHKA